jgi:SAM-dependent methyltransferase
MSTSIDTDRKRDALIERLVQSSTGMFDIYTTYLGDRLGLYQALAATPGCTSAELAQRTATLERYVREWLEQQVVIGTLEVDDAAADATERRYFLPPAHAEVLVDRDSTQYLAPLAQLMVGAVSPLPAIIEAFRTGSGVPLAEYGADVRMGQAGLNRAAFIHLFGHDWLPRVPDVHARLQSDPPARIAEIGSGAGWASIGLALAYPRPRIDGFDLDPPSVALAQANALEMGVAERVHFAVRNAVDAGSAAAYDLVFAFECLHDMADPVGALRAMGMLAGAHGAVIVVDERVGESFAAPNAATEPILYGFSVLHCLPASMVEADSAATGTVMRPNTLRQYAFEAGFREVTILPIENFFYTFYRLLY